jgi:hypothetical protein
MTPTSKKIRRPSSRQRAKEPVLKREAMDALLHWQARHTAQGCPKCGNLPKTTHITIPRGGKLPPKETFVLSCQMDCGFKPRDPSLYSLLSEVGSIAHWNEEVLHYMCRGLKR